jgi:hypothetical protein
MKWWLMFLAATILMPMTARTQAWLEIPEGTKFSFGDVYRGVVVERNLTLKNAGTDTLVINRVDASCGCTGTVLSDRRLPKGGTGTLQITFNSKNFSGPIHKTVTVNSNAANTPQLFIEFTANVIDEILITPSQLWFKDAEVGRMTKVLVSVKNNGSEVLSLRSCRSTLEGLEIHLPATPIQPGASEDVAVEFTPKKAVPFLSEGVFLVTSNTHQPEVYIPIYGNTKEFKFQ